MFSNLGDLNFGPGDLALLVIALVILTVVFFIVKEHVRVAKPFVKSYESELFVPCRKTYYVGKAFRLVHPIVGGSGVLRIQGANWKIIGADLPAGHWVVVVGHEDNYLLVKETGHVGDAEPDAAHGEAGSGAAHR
jgi:membrane protein implicated in regulation of membrane protease activity